VTNQSWKHFSDEAKFTVTTVPISHKTITENVLTIAVGDTYFKDKRLNRHHF